MTFYFSHITIYYNINLELLLKFDWIKFEGSGNWPLAGTNQSLGLNELNTLQLPLTYMLLSLCTAGKTG